MPVNAAERMVHGVPVIVGDTDGEALPLWGGTVLVASGSRADAWHIVRTRGRRGCTCESWMTRKDCKHMPAALSVASEENERVQIKPEFIITGQGGKQMVLYAGLLDAAHEAGLKSITTKLRQVPGPDNGQTAIVTAQVEMADGRLFEGIGDANPGNVTRLVASHTIRMAETRAKSRALRDAINIGALALEGDVDEDEGEGQAPPPTANRQQQPRYQESEPRREQQRPQQESEQPQQGRSVLCPIHQVAIRANMTSTGYGHDLGVGHERGWCDVSAACDAAISELMAVYRITLADIDGLLMTVPSIAKGWVDLTPTQRAQILPRLGDWAAKKKAESVGA